MGATMTKFTFTSTVCVVAMVLAGIAKGAPTSAEVSLNNCQNAVKVETAKFIHKKIAAIGACLQAISTLVVKYNAPALSGAAGLCVTQFRSINDSRGKGRSLPEKLTAGIAARCTPGFPHGHTLFDILGTGATVSQPLDVESIGAWCAHFGGDGTISSLSDWTACITASADCSVDAAIATQYPRALEWLDAVELAMLALFPPAIDPTKISDAVAGLTAVRTAIAGPSNGSSPDIQCGGIRASGTAVAADVLAGKTFSNDTANGLTGTMPNNGPANFTPGAAPVPVPPGYYSGGQVNTDPNLTSTNIKSGASIFGVAGSSAVVDTSSATATAADLLSGKTAFVNGSPVTGSVPPGTDVNGANGSPAFTIPDGLYSGSKAATASDTNLVSGNIASGVTIFGVTGSVVPLTQSCGNNLSEGSEVCDGVDLNGTSCATAAASTPYGTLACNNSCTGFDTSACKARFVDNGDGTVTDNSTRLIWEQKTTTVGSGVNLVDPHDVDNTYTWGSTSAPYPPNGTAFTDFLANLNGGLGPNTCFANQCDWRLPSIAELQTIVAASGDPTIDPIFGPTQPDFYWSSSTIPAVPTFAVAEFFHGGGGTFGDKTSNLYVRAVRGGL